MKEENLTTWLDRHFPNQFVVDRSLRDIHPKHFYEKKNTSIVSSASDPDVQFEITWYKTQEDLGITIDQITTLAANSKRDIESARAWKTKLTEHGLDRFAVGVVDHALYVLPYGDPLPANRLKTLQQVVSAVAAAPDAGQTSIYIEFMEDSAYQREIKDIIPFGYWRRKDTFHDDHKIVMVDFEFTPDVTAEDINAHWTYNTLSLRSRSFLDAAFLQAEAWAKINLRQPYYLEPTQYVEYSLDQDDPLSVHYSFPVFPSKPDYDTYVSEEQRLGFVTGIFQTDKRTFTQIRKAEEL